jgi:hypothetical protein
MKPGLARTAALSLLLFSVAIATSCTIKTSKHDDDDKATETKGAEITTPFGSLKARNEENGEATGLSIYPGARVTHDKDNDHGGNVVIDTPAFGLKVIAVKYESDDSPDKVLDYYRKELRQYGKKVVECHSSNDPDDVNIDKVDRKEREVSCDKEDSGGKTTELKAGTENNQHVVGVEPNGKGTKFALVWVRVRGDRDNTM